MSQELDGILREFIPASWFHPEGVKKILRKLEPRLPNVSGCLFITLTLDPGLFQGPRSGFEKARDRIRRIFYKLRRGIKWAGKTYKLKAAYCIKLEFHENGWPHFHIIFLSKRFLPAELLNELWKYGRTNIARIKNHEFRYLLKYVSKSGEIPDWVKEYRTIRIFTASRGFYRERDPPEKKERARKDLPRRKRGKLGTIAERQEKWARLAQYEERGKFSRFEMDEPWKEVFPRLVYDIAQEGRYLGEGKIKITTTKDLLQLLSEETKEQLK